MKAKFRDWNQFYQRIILVFNGIIALSLLPFAWVFLEMERGTGGLSLMDGIMKIIFQVILFMVIAVILFVTHRDFRRSLAAIPKDYSISQKLTAYFQLQIRKLIFFEIAAILALVATYINSDYLFIAAYVFILFLFSLGRPRYDTVVSELNLSKTERKALEEGKELSS